MTHLPLFPLNTVLFPKTPLPLHIFEERYRILVANCIEREEPFGVVYHKGEKIEQIGCTAQVERILKQYDDGRLDIVTVGRQRFSIESVDNSEPYLQGLVRYLDDDDESGFEGEELATEAVDAVLRYSYYAQVEIDRSALHELSITDLSFLIAGIDEMGLETQQKLLEIDSSARRLEQSILALEGVTEQLVAVTALRAATGQDIDFGSLKN